MPVYLVLINALALGFMCADKYFAVRHRRRVPEAALLALAALGGAGGALLGMALAHHKTRKPKFYITVPLLLAVHLYVFFVVYGVQPLN